MKPKIFFLLLILFSCSSESDSDQDNNDDGNNNSENNLLVSEIISSDSVDNLYEYTERFFYDDGDGLDGNKLTSTRSSYIVDGGEPQETSYSNYIYTNGKITRVFTYSGWDEELTGDVTFYYDNNGRLISAEECNYFSNGVCQEFSNTEFSYSNNNQTITEEYEEYYEDSSYSSTVIWQLDNQGNISSGSATWEDTYEGVTENGSGAVSFQYDNKNSPFKNIAGMNAMILMHLGLAAESFDAIQYSPFNNITSLTFSSTSTCVGTISYDYNNFDYPRQFGSTSCDGYTENGIINYY